jgi:hypothetical protein
MLIPVNLDLFAFFYTVGVILFGSLPRLRKNARAIPLQYQFEELPPEVLSEAQSKYLASYDKKLAAMNYSPVSTFRAVNFDRALIRRYGNPMETSRCAVIILATTVKVKGKPSVTNSCTMEFITRFSDDKILITRNARLKSLMDNPDFRIVQDCPGVTEPSEMKRKHDARAAGLGCPVPPAATAASIFKEVNREHERFSAYQLARGIYRMHPDGNGYALSDKTFRRGIRNFLNPFAHRFSLRSFLTAALAGVALPVVGILILAPKAANAAQAAGFPPVIATDMMTCACYLLAGTLVGFFLERHTFIWAFLITYVAVHVVVGWSPQPLPYSLFAGLVAHAAARAKRRSGVVLLPQPAR